MEEIKCRFQSDLQSRRKGFSHIFCMLSVMMGVNDGARLEEKRKLCVWGSKMAAPKEEWGGRKPWEVSKNPPLLHVILFHIFSSCRKKKKKKRGGGEKNFIFYFAGVYFKQKIPWTQQQQEGNLVGLTSSDLFWVFLFLYPSSVFFFFQFLFDLLKMEEIVDRIRRRHWFCNFFIVFDKK